MRYPILIICNGLCLLGLTACGSVPLESPSVPGNLVATTVSTSQIDLTWSAATDNLGVQFYLLYRDKASIPHLDAVETTSFSDTDLLPETEYCYVVSSSDAARNESAKSDPVCATTLSKEPLTLVVTHTGSGSGKVIVSPTGADCGAFCSAYYTQTIITLTATPADTSFFFGWSGDCSGTTSPITVALTPPNANKICTAMFDLLPPPLVTVINIAAGVAHTCASISDGTVKCWGRNGFGQLGNGAKTDSNILPVAVNGIATATSVTAGSHHTCVLLSNGTVKCWGYNGFGQLGNGTSGDYSTTPVEVNGITNATVLVAGEFHTCALLSDRKVKCWGHNGNGQLGNGTNTYSGIPVEVNGITTATDVTAGTYHTCARLTSGRVKCWGFNDFGQLGNGTTTYSNIPVAVNGMTTATNVTAGASHTCARLTGGRVNCWGNNDFGQLGNGTTTYSNIPVAVNGINTATGVATGAEGNHTCAILSNGILNCWGNNVSGQLGNGSNISSSTPVAITEVSIATAVATGSSHTCARLSNRMIQCWGNNSYGQLGNGTTTNSTTPQTVLNTP